MNTLVTASPEPAQQYLTFVLGDEHYAVDTLYVREILECTRFTPVPVSYTHLTLPTTPYV